VQYPISVRLFIRMAQSTVLNPMYVDDTSTEEKRDKKLRTDADVTYEYND
jgi:hypothetical protein